MASPPERPPRAGRRIATPARIAVLGVIAAAIVLIVVVLQSGGAKTPSPSPTAHRPSQGDIATPIFRQGTPEATYPQQVTGADGTSITLRQAPQRIVVLAPGTAEILYAIGAGGQIAGVIAEPDYPPAMAAAPAIDPATAAGAVAAAHPDLVIAGEGAEALGRTLAAQGLPAVVVDAPSTVTGVLQQIQYFGNLTNHLSQAQTLAAKLRARVDTVQRALNSTTQGPRVYDEAATPQRAAGPSSLTGDLLTLLKAQNVAPRETDQSPPMSTEQIVAANPEVIFISATAPGETVDDVEARPGWSGIAAVANGKVYVVDAALVSRPGPRIVDGLEALAKLLYPGKL